MQQIIWILAGTSVVNALTIFCFIIRKFLSCKRNPSTVEHEYTENIIEVRPPNNPAGNFNNPNKDNIPDEDTHADAEEVIYDDMELHNI